jgi:hypothetical protein
VARFAHRRTVTQSDFVDFSAHVIGPATICNGISHDGYDMAQFVKTVVASSLILFAAANLVVVVDTVFRIIIITITITIIVVIITFFVSKAVLAFVP